MALGFMATQASAETSAFGVEYRWLASLDMLGETTQLAIPERSLPKATFMQLMVKPFVKFNSARGLSQDDLATGFFRRPDPDFGLPQAFRRQQQMRLGFSIRF